MPPLPQYTRLERGEIGELLLNQVLDKQGYHVFHDLSKKTATNGIDLVAYDPATKRLLVFDNKAWEAGIGDAPALTGPQFEGNLKIIEEYLETQTEKESIAALRALRQPGGAGVEKVLGNAFANDAGRFTRGAFQKGLSVFDVRLGRIFRAGEQAAWEAAFRALVVERGARILGQRGAIRVGPLIVVAAVSAGVLYVIRSDAQVQEAAGELVVATAADIVATVVTKSSPIGWIVGFLSLMKDDRGEAAHQRDDRVEAIRKVVLPAVDFDHLSGEEQGKVLELVEQLADAPLEVPEKPEPPAKPLYMVPWPRIKGRSPLDASSWRQSSNLAKVAADSGRYARQFELNRQQVALQLDTIHGLQRQTFAELERVQELNRLAGEHTREATSQIQRITNQINQHENLRTTIDTSALQRTGQLLEESRRQTTEATLRAVQTHQSMVQRWNAFYVPNRPPSYPVISNWGQRGWDGRPIGGI